MEENMNLDHDDDEISPVEHELDPEQENMNLDSGSQYSFIDFMGVGAQHDDNIDDLQELDPALENMNLDLGFTPYSVMDFMMGLSAQHDLIPQEPADPAPDRILDDINLDLGLKPYSFTDFIMSLSAQQGDEIDIDDLIPQEPDPAQVHHHQRDSTCSDVNDARLEDRVYSLSESLPTGKVERITPEDRTVRLDLDMRLPPETSLRHLRHEGPQFLTLQLDPTLDPALDPALNSTSEPATSDPVSLDPVTAEFEGWAAWIV